MFHNSHVIIKHFYKSNRTLKSITIIQADDWHLHFRDEPYLNRTVKDTANQFSRAIVMPNLTPPIRTAVDAFNYQQRILKHVPKNSNFKPLMTLYLTDNTRAQDIEDGADSEHVYAAKLYPAGATTNSEFGVSKIENLYPVFEAMQKVGLPLLIHGEATDPEIDVFDREKEFIDQTLIPIRKQFPNLKIVFEHITTKDAVDYILQSNHCLGATITPQHLLINRNALFKDGIRPHHYCLPVVKREKHRVALNAVVINGDPHFFAGTDSAPHSQDKKESSCGCAGIYSAFHALELYAEVFERNNNFTHFESFMSKNGAKFYDLALNTKSTTLIKKPWTVPETLNYTSQSDKIIPFMAGENLTWRINND